MKIHDVAVTPDGNRLLGVGPLLSSPSGLQPSKSRGEKRIIGRFFLRPIYVESSLKQHSVQHGDQTNRKVCCI